MYPPLSYRAVKFIVSYHPELVSNTVISLKNVHPAESNLHVYFFQYIAMAIVIQQHIKPYAIYFGIGDQSQVVCFCQCLTYSHSILLMAVFFLLFSRKNVKIISGSLARNHLGNYSCVVPMHSSQSVAPMSRVRQVWSSI